MPTGRKSVFTIYDETAYQELKEYLFKTKQDASHYVWSLILQDLSRLRQLESISDPNTKITNFGYKVIPPKIIDDFINVIKPYMKNSNKDELSLMIDNGYNTYRFGMFLYMLKKYTPISDQTIQNSNFSEAEIISGLDELESISNEKYFRKSEIKPEDVIEW